MNNSYLIVLILKILLTVLILKTETIETKGIEQDHQQDSNNNGNILPLYAKGLIINSLRQKRNVNSKATLICPITSMMGLSCAADDCSTFMICSGQSPTPIFSGSCESQSLSTPYCVNGICSGTPDPNKSNCQSKSSTFLCTASGSFPDPHDCSKFHICDAPNANPITYQCPKSYRYISSMKTCRLTSVCQTFQCNAASATGKMASYLYDPGYYGICYKSSPLANVYNIIMYKCTDEIDFVYDASQNQCTFKCRYIGNHVDRLNCNRYHSCYFSSGRYYSISMPCPSGYYFDSTTLLCKKGTHKCQTMIVSDSTPLPSTISSPSSPSTTTSPSTTSSPLSPSSPVSIPTPGSISQGSTSVVTSEVTSPVTAEVTTAVTIVTAPADPTTIKSTTVNYTPGTATAKV